MAVSYKLLSWNAFTLEMTDIHKLKAEKHESAEQQRQQRTIAKKQKKRQQIKVPESFFLFRCILASAHQTHLSTSPPSSSTSFSSCTIPYTELQIIVLPPPKNRENWKLMYVYLTDWSHKHVCTHKSVRAIIPNGKHALMLHLSHFRAFVSFHGVLYFYLFFVRRWYACAVCVLLNEKEI